MADHFNPQPDLFGAEDAKGRKSSDAVEPKAEPANLHPDETYMTVAQAAKRYQVSRSTIWRWVKVRKGFPAPFEIAEGTTRWALSDFVAFDRNLRRKHSRASQKRAH